MLGIEQIQQLIQECRELGEEGLNNGLKATIPDLIIDIVSPPSDFLGVNGNPAIFVNQKTYNLLGGLHPDWVVNRTIAIKKSFLSQTPIDVIGAIIHETGHAFNVAAKIPNSETNSYIFELEVLLKLLQLKVPLISRCSEKDDQSFFKSRLPYYTIGISSSDYLQSLVKYVKTLFKLEHTTMSAKEIKETLLSQLIKERTTLFATKPGDTDSDSKSTINPSWTIKMLLLQLLKPEDENVNQNNNSIAVA